MTKHNHLSSAEMYKLSRFVETTQKPFASWKQALHAASAAVNREVTRSNLETALANTDRSIADFVEVNESNNPIANIMSIVHDLKKRIQKLEDFVGSCK